MTTSMTPISLHAKAPFHVPLHPVTRVEGCLSANRFSQSEMWGAKPIRIIPTAIRHAFAKTANNLLLPLITNPATNRSECQMVRDFLLSLQIPLRTAPASTKIFCALCRKRFPHPRPVPCNSTPPRLKPLFAAIFAERFASIPAAAPSMPPTDPIIARSRSAS